MKIWRKKHSIEGLDLPCFDLLVEIKPKRGRVIKARMFVETIGHKRYIHTPKRRLPITTRSWLLENGETKNLDWAKWWRVLV